MTTVTMIDMATLSAQIAKQVGEWPALVTLGLNVDRSEAVNDDPNRTPWFCVYRQGVTFEARALGRGAGYRRQRATFILALQASSVRSGIDCETALEELVRETISALLSDESLGGLVDTLGELVTIEYVAAPTRGGQAYMQGAYIRVEALANVSVA